MLQTPVRDHSAYDAKRRARIATDEEYAEHRREIMRKARLRYNEKRRTARLDAQVQIDAQIPAVEWVSAKRMRLTDQEVLASHDKHKREVQPRRSDAETLAYSMELKRAAQRRYHASVRADPVAHARVREYRRKLHEATRADPVKSAAQRAKLREWYQARRKLTLAVAT